MYSYLTHNTINKHFEYPKANLACINNYKKDYNVNSIHNGKVNIFSLLRNGKHVQQWIKRKALTSLLVSTEKKNITIYKVLHLLLYV